MIPAQSAIARLRRDLTVSSVLKSILIAGVALSIFLQAAGLPLLNGSLLLVVVFVIWIALSYVSIRGSRIAAISPSLIAAGEYEQAEEFIDQALRSFSLFRGIKLRTVHQLAILRHAQRKWVDAALLCQALLGQRLGPLSGLARSTRLILADALLEVGDLHGAYQAIKGLYSERLSLGEAIDLTAVQIDYLARVSAWEQMMQDIQRKLDLAELLPGPRSARVQALLALAAGKCGQANWQHWLRRRAELLADARELVEEREILKQVWPDAPAISAGQPHGCST